MVEGLITNTGKRIFLQRHYQPVPVVTAPTQFKTGQGQTSPTITDTDLQDSVPIYGENILNTCDVVTGWTGNADTSFSVNTVTKKKGVASLQVTKTGISTNLALATITVTPISFVDKEFSIWIYFKDASMLTKLAVSALSVRFGTDASNYYQWDVPKSALNTGWNLITHKVIAGASSTVGTPTPTNMAWIQVQLNTTAVNISWVAGDCMFDDVKAISSANYFKTYESGYPELDIPNIQAEIRFRLSTVEANGYLIGETGLFNTDPTPLIESRDIFAPLSKSESDELLFVVKTIVE